MSMRTDPEPGSDLPTWLETLMRRREPGTVEALRRECRGSPAERARFEEEVGLERLLNLRRRAEPSAGFVAGVLTQVRRDAAFRRRGETGGWRAWLGMRIRWWVPVSGAVGLSWLIWWQAGEFRRDRLARSVMEVTTVAVKMADVDPGEVDAVERLPSMLTATRRPGAGARPVPGPPDLPPPMPPASRAVVDQLRALVSADLAHREERLGQVGANVQQYLRARLAQLDALGADERELVLRLEELQHHFADIVRESGTVRDVALRRSPAHLRPLLEDRVRAWEALDRGTRSLILENESSLALFAQMERTPVGGHSDLLAQVPEAYRAGLDGQWARWRALPASTRARAVREFERFFRLSADEQERTLAVLSTAERERIEKALADLSRMSERERLLRVRTFSRFAGMSEQERSNYLANAEAWRGFRPREREAWLKLVSTLPPRPPLPPDEGVAAVSSNVLVRP